jgi:hypothetical protein
MKKGILVIAMLFATGNMLNASTSVSVNTVNLEDSIEQSHYQCKINAISIAFTAAEILGTEPSVGYFKEVYMECMGY